MKYSNVVSAIFGLIVIATTSVTHADILSFDADFDRWMYAFNSSPGNRNLAPTFFDGQDAMFDNMDGQFIVGFNTAAAGVTPLAPGEMYQINSITVTATHSTGSFTYDPTFDNYATYLDPGDPDYVADSDAGSRPIELYGVGLRNGYTSFGFAGGITAPPVFNEGSLFGFADPTQPNVRSAYAYDPSFGDVSNAIDNAFFAASPWGVGQAAGLNPGDAVPQGVAGTSAGQTFSFDVDLGHAGVLDYVTNGLLDGGLFFTIVSLHETTQAGGGTPNFYTKDNFDPAALAPTITIDYEIVPVPEPSTFVLAALGLMGLVACRVRGRKSQLS